MKELVERMIELRKAKGLTQSEVAKMLCVSLQTYRRWERGLFPRYGFEYLIRIRSFYGVTLDYLCGVE